jgi:hypothetical protein
MAFGIERIRNMTRAQRGLRAQTRVGLNRFAVDPDRLSQLLQDNLQFR